MPIEGPAIVAASWFAPSGAPIESAAPVRRLTHGGTTVGWVIPAGEHWERPTRGRARAGGGWRPPARRLRSRHRARATAHRRLRRLSRGACDRRARGQHRAGRSRPNVICLRAAVEPGVVFDVRHGVVVIEEGAEVRSGTRLEGPVYVGRAAPGCWAGSSGHRCSGPSAGCAARSRPACSWATATRRTTGSSATASSATGSTSAPARRPPI